MSPFPFKRWKISRVLGMPFVTFLGAPFFEFLGLFYEMTIDFGVF